MMHGITITDSTEDGRFLVVELKDILDLAGPSAEESEWELAAVECVDGAAADEIHRLADCRARVPGRVLLQLAADVKQVIDGVFAGYRQGEPRPWIIIRAVDSAAFDVESEDPGLLTRLRQHFRSVSDLPG
jgi:hypothetical protein